MGPTVTNRAVGLYFKREHMKKKILEFSGWIGKSVLDAFTQEYDLEREHYSSYDKDLLFNNLRKLISDLQALEQELKTKERR